jgi:hypothetical protein
VEFLTKEKPDLTDLKIFGCGAYVYLPKEKRPNKLSPRSELMTFIGYETGVKGWRFVRPFGTIFIGATATFDENLFPRCPGASVPGQTEFGDLPPDDSEDHTHSEGTDNGNDDYPPDPPLPPSSDTDMESDDDRPSGELRDAPADLPPPPPPVTPEDFVPRHQDQDEYRNAPHRSGRQRIVTNRPGNIYGDNRLPSDIERDIVHDRYWRRTVDQDLSSSRT